MTTAVAVIIRILLSIIASLSMLLLYAVFGVKKSINQLTREQKMSNSLLREIKGQSSEPGDTRQPLHRQGFSADALQTPGSGIHDIAGQ